MRVRPPFAVAVASAALCGCPAIPPEGPSSPEGPALEVPSDPDPASRPFTEEEKAQSQGKLGGVWASCYQTFKPESDPTADLARLTFACGRPTGLAAVTPVRVGEVQGQEDAVERFTFLARAGRCYRVFAVAAPEIADLDLTVLDPKGHLAAADLSRDRFPIVPPRGALCAAHEGAYTLEVSVAEGKGLYVLQIWGE